MSHESSSRNDSTSTHTFTSLKNNFIKFAPKRQRKGRGKYIIPSLTIHRVPMETQTDIHAPGARITPARTSTSAVPNGTVPMTVSKSVSAGPKLVTVPQAESSVTKTGPKAAAVASAVAAINARNASRQEQASISSGPVTSKSSVCQSSSSTATPHSTLITSTKPLAPITQPLKLVQTPATKPSAATIEPLKLKNCTSCIARFPADSNFKRCDCCREKGRERSRMKYLKAAAARAKTTPAEAGSEDSSNITLHPKAGSNNIKHIEALPSASVGTKRKITEIASETLKPAKKSKKAAIRVTEYQTADRLYEDLKRRFRTKKANTELSAPPTNKNIQFSGCYSIVMDTTTGHASKLDSVFDDLKAYIKYGGDLPSKPKEESGLSRTVKCCCGNHVSTSSSCGGTIKISVSEDKSHPFIPGQKIDIRVHHSSPT